jgi:sulfite reductase beta subunit-like hemoprotein
MSVVTDAPKKRKLLEVEETEIQRFKDNIAALKSGRFDPDDFKKFRLNNGIYGIRNQTDKQMVRIKVSFGEMSSDQLDGLADITERFAPSKLGHFTTRQNLQIHQIPLEQIPDVMRACAEIGYTTREACGNTVRTITASPFAGVHPDEAFDTTPYALATFNHFLRNPLNANLPRKFKMAFESSPHDFALTPIHDLGFVAEVKNGARGFRVYCGGGLGATPQAAFRLEDWTPAELLLPSIETVIRLFDRYGERKDKMHARLKFLVKKWGEAEFKERFQAERRLVLSTRSGAVDWTFPVVEEAAPAAPSGIPHAAPTPAYERWKSTNVLPQKQAGYSCATVVLPLGDITAKAMRELASIARQFCGGRMRTTVEQNILLRWVKTEHLPALHAALLKAGLAQPGANRFSDVTRCPGADTCQIAVTKSRELAIAVGGLFTDGLSADADMEGVHVKISGCTNSCGQHHIGTLGFYGTYRKINDRPVPHYQLLIGGGTKEGQAKFGQPVAAIPARRVPDAMKAIVAAYKKDKQGNETLAAWLDRAGRARVKEAVQEFTQLPPYEQDPTMYYDWGDTSDFKAEIGVGECAA